MKPQEHQEISANEQWLAEVLPPDVSQSTQHLKLRVRVEINEQWLNRHLNSQDPERTAEGLGQTVRRAVVEARESDRVQIPANAKARRWFTAVGLGLAAVLALSLTIFRAGEANIPAFEYDITAFEEDADEIEFDEELDEALAELDDLLASRDEIEWNDVLEEM